MLPQRSISQGKRAGCRLVGLRLWQADCRQTEKLSYVVELAVIAETIVGYSTISRSADCAGPTTLPCLKWSSATFRARAWHFCFAPDSRLIAVSQQTTFRANRVIWHRSKTGRSITSSTRASSVGTARCSSITRLLLRSHHPDAAHLALLNELNKSNVGLVECIVPHWGASLSGFFTQPLIHCQSFLQNWSPFFRQIS